MMGTKARLLTPSSKSRWIPWFRLTISTAISIVGVIRFGGVSKLGGLRLYLLKGSRAKIA